MAVTEIERTELANRLVLAIGKEATETLMNCIIPEGRDQLATKDDLRVLSAEMRSYVDSAISKHTRLIMTTMVGFMLTIWITLLVPAIV
ncbi:hypothetical protein [Candidatus Poriferisocius sp.]|uniref:hypothetical protein n=1 Tax=Candidatus Poriferisocius sp. TaxID=3101276 RepID=UPI003B5A5769